MRILKKTVYFLAAAIIFLGGCSKEEEEEIFRWYFSGETFADSEAVYEAANEIIKEKLGVKVDFCPIPGKYYDQKMKTIIMSDEDFDICFTSNWMNNFQDNVYNNKFFPITVLLEKTPYLLESIPDFVWDCTRYDSEIYAVPNYQILYSQSCLEVEKEIYEKYKEYLTNIQNIEDLEPFLAEAQKDEPGSAKISNSFGPEFWLNNEQIVGAEMFSVKRGEDRVFCQYLQPDYFEYITLMSDWFRKGYINNDIYSGTQNTETWVVTNQYKPGAVKYDKSGKRRSIEYIILNEPMISQNVGGVALTAINKNSKNPEMALKIIELVNKDKELYNTLCFGIEGIHYEKETEDVIKLTDFKMYNPNKAWMFGNQFNAYYTNVQSAGAWEETDKINKSAKKGKLYGFRFDIRPVKNELMVIESIISDYQYLSAGVEDIGTDYEEFKEKLEEAGVLKVQEEIQSQIDEFLKKGGM